MADTIETYVTLSKVLVTTSFYLRKFFRRKPSWYFLPGKPHKLVYELLYSLNKLVKTYEGLVTPVSSRPRLLNDAMLDLWKVIESIRHTAHIVLLDEGSPEERKEILTIIYTKRSMLWTEAPFREYLLRRLESMLRINGTDGNITSIAKKIQELISSGEW